MGDKGKLPPLKYGESSPKFISQFFTRFAHVFQANEIIGIRDKRQEKKYVLSRSAQGTVK
jgi:hypothetical protein